MVSDKPRGDRCGAKVQDKNGLEVHDDGGDIVYSTDESMESVVFEKGSDEIVVADPNYGELWDYKNNDYRITAVICLEDDEETRVSIEDDDPYNTHTHVELDGYCERYKMDSGRCYVHGGASTGTPTPVENRMEHGLEAKRSNYYDTLDESDKIFIEKMVESWLEAADFTRDNFAKVNELYRIGVDQLRLWNAQDEFEDGIVTDQVVGQDEEGEPVYAVEENPANLPYDRLDKSTFRKLRDLGCLDSPEDKQAEATQSLADKFGELGED